MNYYVLYTKVLFLVAILFLAGCKRGSDNTATPTIPTPEFTAESGQTITPPTIEPPTPTVIPLAALVNGEGITLAEYQAELNLYQAASGEEITPEDGRRVLEDLISQTILAQAATEQGFVLDEEVYQERYQYLQEQRGGVQGLADWMSAYEYTEESFRLSLGRAIRSAWMRDQIINAVPMTADQVHVVQILLYTQEEANQVFAQLQAGNDFGNLAVQYDPITGGDLGWFPRGYLLDQKLEEAAFGLAPGEYSPVIETLAGFHILLIVERDPTHPLSPEALLILQEQALNEWLETHLDGSDIQRMIP